MLKDGTLNGKKLQFDEFLERMVAEEVAKQLAPKPLMVKYTLTHPNARVPYKKHAGDVGWDLYTVEDLDIPAGHFADVPTGIRIEMPTGVWCRITGRSSTWRTHHLQVQEGIIDTGYTGELFAGVRNPSASVGVLIPAGTRLAQAIFHQSVIPDTWVQSNDLNSSDERGADGFGSTGKGKW